jgi:hypothetical protein
VLLGELESEAAVDGAQRGTAVDQKAAGGDFAEGASSTTSYSSSISPTISSKMSSRVTIPSTPPYSSTTTARWTRLRRKDCSNVSIRFDSGTKYGGRAIRADQAANDG